MDFNVVYQRFIAMYDSGYCICFNWSRLKPYTADKHDTPSKLMHSDRTLYPLGQRGGLNG